MLSSASEMDDPTSKPPTVTCYAGSIICEGFDVFRFHKRSEWVLVKDETPYDRDS